jgi:hypothetical protein
MTDDTKANELLCMTELPDSYFSDVSELVASLQDNLVTENVHFAGEFLNGLPQQEQADLLGQVGQLKSLKEIHLVDASIQASVLSKVIETAKDLQVFHLGRVVLEGNQDDFIDLEFSIRHHAVLTQLVWENFTQLLTLMSCSMELSRL